MKMLLLRAGRRYITCHQVGVTHLTAVDDVDCIQKLKQLLSYIPQNSIDLPFDFPYKVGNEIREQLNSIVSRRQQ